VVLGMHRSGTSALAGMLAAAGVASAGPSVRNWDNARGHHEALALVRLNEAVLAASGGHWLCAPAEVRWSAEHAAERDRLLGAMHGGRPALLKDPRTLLCLPFWRASALPFHALGIVRAPLAVARSLLAWRGIPLAEGLALWSAHNRALLAERERSGLPLVDFDLEARPFVEAVHRACRALGLEVDVEALRAGHEERLVHHDAAGAAEVAGLVEARELHRGLVGPGAPAVARHPNEAMERFERARAAGDPAAAEAALAEALAGVADAAAVVVPALATLSRARDFEAAGRLLERAAPRLEPGLAQLLRGKLCLARDDDAGALAALQAACAVPEPFHQARRLLPHALRRAGRRAEAARILAAVAEETLYPHVPLALLAEWTWDDGEATDAIERMRTAILRAPLHRRGRLRVRRAQWLRATEGPDAAREELGRALTEDPTYERARRALEDLGARDGAAQDRPTHGTFS